MHSLFVFMLSFTFVIALGFLNESESTQVLYSLFISILSLDIQLSEGVVTPLIGLISLHFDACPMSGSGFQRHIFVVFFPTQYVVVVLC